MADTTTLKGRRITGSARPSRTVQGDRRCSKRGCETILSQYNKREYCFAHAPVRFPRVRGRIITDGTA